MLILPRSVALGVKRIEVLFGVESSEWLGDESGLRRSELIDMRNLLHPAKIF
jgi:hypothetical protein